MAVGMDDPKKQLVQLLEKYKVPKPCIEYMTTEPAEGGTGGMGMASISDFASCFMECDYAEGVRVHIVAKVAAVKDADIIPVARLRTAWIMAKAELDKAKKRKIEGAPDIDWDTPLEDGVENQRKRDFETLYGGLEFESESTPGAAIMGRMFREFRSEQRHVTLTSLHKMRSEADFKQLGTVVKKKIAEGVELVSQSAPGLPDVHFYCTLTLMEAVRLMTNGWALTGNTMVESKTYFDNVAGQFKKVQNCHLSQAISYYDFVFRKAVEYVGSDDAKVRWVLERDRQTRAKAKNLYAAGWPWGEAIHEAKDKHCLVLWTIGNTGSNARAPTAVLPDMVADDERAHPGGFATRSRKRRQNQLNQAAAAGKDFCPFYNSARGCTKKTDKCPNKKKHKCSKCGMNNHGAHKCRRQG